MSLLLFLTLVAGPVVALGYTQIRFLPYQSWGVTLLHRLLLVFDLLIILTAVEAAFRSGGFGRPLVGRWFTYPAVVALICFSFFVRFPGEWNESPIPDWPNPEIWPFPTTLQLANEQFVEEMNFDLDEVSATLKMRERKLVGADFGGADLRKAVFDFARLHGASLKGAGLEGALFAGVSLQGASLDEAGLQGASLEGAKLQGASLDIARLQGTSLEGAKLQGASLGLADLRGVSLDGARLQGASLALADLRGASLNSTFFWRAYGLPDPEDPEGVRVVRPELQPLTEEEIVKLVESALAGVEAETTKQRITESLARLSLSKQEVGDSLPDTYWTNLVLKSEADHQGYLADLLLDLACDVANGPFVAQSLTKRVSLIFFKSPRLVEVGATHLPHVASVLLDAAEGKTDSCLGAVGVNAESISNLREWVAEGEPVAVTEKPAEVVPNEAARPAD